jgi:FAD/FMN-containing dehydrogenase/Fe-S oxidoreductase
MIPRLNTDAHLPSVYSSFLAELKRAGFEGDIHADYATRLSAATDNSVYQVLPAAVVMPKHKEDVSCLLRLAQREEFRKVTLSARGGGTGTNGQALSEGLVVDLSRHLNAILEVNLEEGWVRVQPGVVLDQLNAKLAPHGVFFAPNLSPSSRATIGGMINTDASGKGSRVYGKTSEHVLSLEVVLADGSLLHTQPLGPAELVSARAREDLTGAIYREVDAVLERSLEKVQVTLPKLRRFLTGYDLAHVRREDGLFDLSRLLCGSEGTLGLLTEAKLKLTPLPRYKQLIAIRYANFDAALRAAGALVRANPGAIETIDDTIVELARGDVIWHAVAHLIEAAKEPPLRAINLVEFESSEPGVVEAKAAELSSALDAEIQRGGGASGYTIVTNKADIAALWTLRKKGVGLLGNAKGERRPVPFVEDTAVPPEHLADYIAEFRSLLDRHGLRYGMFGHVDVGCLHVRPALNLRDPEDEALLHQLSDEVVLLVKKYGGVLWGEHGRGYRSQYTPTFFGPELYRELRAIKTAFDPHNQLNPGKLATPLMGEHELVSVTSRKRGELDRQITVAARERYEVAVHCNGNGACFDWNPDSVMCPSSKVTRDRIHSPKGRAGMLREWLRLLSNAGYDAGKEAGSGELALFHGRAAAPADFSHAVYDAMAGCLACKACATQCPIKVDIPELRAEFLQQYHTRYRRPLRDFFVAGLEGMLRVLALAPGVANWLLRSWFTRRLLHWVGIVDTPLLAEVSLERSLRERGALVSSLSELERLSPEEKRRTVLILQDAFTTFYEPEVALAAHEVLSKLGRRPLFLPFRPNGKALHVRGFLRWFRSRARTNAEYLAEVSGLGLPIVGLEPAVTLTYREEYRHVASAEEHPYQILLLQEYLRAELPKLLAEEGELPSLGGKYRLFGHCTETATVASSGRDWRFVFEALGAELAVESVGCCGMCGVFGHELEHREESRGVFALSWHPRLPKQREERLQVLATGHSCRSQVKRFEGFVPRHPLEALRDGLQRSAAVGLARAR